MFVSVEWELSMEANRLTPKEHCQNNPVKQHFRPYVFSLTKVIKLDTVLCR